VVFTSVSKGKEEKITIDKNSGTFKGSLLGSQGLNPGGTYFCRIRQKSSNGAWSSWSRWHQPFKAEDIQSAIR
jgi:hypothetical protein